eukprot:6202524-Pleurochrysis_carterae.AAC.1
MAVVLIWCGDVYFWGTMSLRLLVLIAVLATGECFFGGAGKAPAKKVKATVKSKAPVKKAQTLFGKATTKDLKFSDIPGSLDGAYFGIPIAGWVQIAAFIAALDIAVFRQDPDLPPGDVVQDLPIQWVRYDDPEVKAFKLNIERNNGRAAMMGILGMIVHTALGQDALYPIVSKSESHIFCSGESCSFYYVEMLHVLKPLY